MLSKHPYKFNIEEVSGNIDAVTDEVLISPSIITKNHYMQICTLKDTNHDIYQWLLDPSWKNTRLLRADFSEQTLSHVLCNKLDSYDTHSVNKPIYVSPSEVVTGLEEIWQSWILQVENPLKIKFYNTIYLEKTKHKFLSKVLTKNKDKNQVIENYQECKYIIDRHMRRLKHKRIDINNGYFTAR